MLTPHTTHLIQSLSCFLVSNGSALYFDPGDTISKVHQRIRIGPVWKRRISQPTPFIPKWVTKGVNPGNLGIKRNIFAGNKIKTEVDSYILSEGAGNRRALAEWKKGNCAKAISESCHLHKKKYRDEFKFLEHSDRTEIEPHGQTTTTTDALYVLTSCQPFTMSGYTIRSHNILTSLRAEGLSVAAVTRESYPANIGKVPRTNPTVHEGISYFHHLPHLPSSLTSKQTREHAGAIIKLSRRLKPAVLHSTTDWRNGTATRLAARSLGLPWIYEMRGEIENTWLSGFPKESQRSVMRSDRYLSLRRIESELATSADAVIVLSEYQAESMLTRGVASKKIHVLPNSVSERTAAKAVDKFRSQRELGLRPGFWIGTVTSVVDYEGLELLVEALYRLLKSGHDINLAVVGSGSALNSLRAKARELEVEDHCHFPGRVPEERAHEYYHALDLFCLPRKDTAVTRVVTPLKSLQASALGIPVMASDLPALREVVPADHLDLLVKPEDPAAWASAIGSVKSGRIRIDPEKARSFARTRTWEHQAKRLAALYSSLSVSAG
ncbi:glycosyltransferase [Corynebacterium pygosceleis]|uniref:glycosyltransferase n=1 Tax=Corynebacterium pygosceleis TaxID=2800406 RepID=UPI00200310C2|nr:glycosyltransferase [Corynebacterium pygosceleis]MCK7676244.1 glycosyltransferase [Corynebacterium pygosceleis]